MSVLPELTYRLSDKARGMCTAAGISMAEVYRLFKEPEMRLAGNGPGETRVNGYGLSAIVRSDGLILTVQIDGADRDNWSEWARERAVFGDGDADGAFELLAADARAWQRSQPWIPRKRSSTETIASPVERGHILDSVHPSFHKEITRLVSGDFSRLVVHSYMSVEILPAP